MATNPISASGISSESLRFDYLNLLVTQLQNQNPLEPLDNDQMAAQLSQFAQLEQLENLNTSFQKVLAATQISQAATLVGKEVRYYSPDDGQVVQGRVDRVEFEAGEARLIVGGHAIGLGGVLAVGEAPAGSGLDSADDEELAAPAGDGQGAARGDYNGDGAVDARDLAILATNYGRTVAEGDFNRDGIVDARDLAILAGNYGRSAAGGT